MSRVGRFAAQLHSPPPLWVDFHEPLIWQEKKNSQLLKAVWQADWFSFFGGGGVSHEKGEEGGVQRPGSRCEEHFEVK